VFCEDAFLRLVVVVLFFALISGIAVGIRDYTEKQADRRITCIKQNVDPAICRELFR